MGNAIRAMAIVPVLGLAGGSHAAPVYRWTDAAGVTHFADQPPAGQPATLIDPRATPPAQDPERARARLEAIRKDIEARAAAREEAEREAAEDAQQTARLAQECEQARAELAAMESARRVTRPDGTTLYGEQRLALMQELRRAIAEHCR